MRTSRFLLVGCLSLWASFLCAAGYEPGFNDEVNSTKEEAAKPRLKRGVHWYRKPSRSTEPEQEKLAYKYYEGGRLRKAANAYQAQVYAWPDSSRAAAAQFALAKIQQKRGKYDAAFKEYQYLVDNYPGQFRYPEVLDLQFQIASYLMQAKVGKWLFLPGFSAPERAIPLFEQIIRNAPSWERAPEAQFNIGRIREINGETEEAIAAYEVLQNRYPSSPWAQQAGFREASCLYLLSDQRRNDENALNAARSALAAFIRTYPSSPDVATAETCLRTLNTRLATLVYERARYYDLLARKPEAALQAYEDFVKNFPHSDLVENARARIEELSGRKP